MALDDSLNTLRSAVESIDDDRLKNAFLHVERDVLTLENEVLRLRNTSQKSPTTNLALLFERSCYWKQVGDQKEGPYCQVCWDTKQQLVHLQQDEEKGWQCKVCNNTFGDEESSPFRFNPPF